MSSLNLGYFNNFPQELLRTFVYQSVQQTGLKGAVKLSRLSKAFHTLMQSSNVAAIVENSFTSRPLQILSPISNKDRATFLAENKSLSKDNRLGFLHAFYRDKYHTCFAQFNMITTMMYSMTFKISEPKCDVPLSEELAPLVDNLKRYVCKVTNTDDKSSEDAISATPVEEKSPEELAEMMQILKWMIQNYTDRSQSSAFFSMIQLTCIKISEATQSNELLNKTYSLMEEASKSRDAIYKDVYKKIIGFSEIAKNNAKLYQATKESKFKALSLDYLNNAKTEIITILSDENSVGVDLESLDTARRLIVKTYGCLGNAEQKNSYDLKSFLVELQALFCEALPLSLPLPESVPFLSDLEITILAEFATTYQLMAENLTDEKLLESLLKNFSAVMDVALQQTDIEESNSIRDLLRIVVACIRFGVQTKNQDLCQKGIDLFKNVISEIEEHSESIKVTRTEAYMELIYMWDDLLETKGLSALNDLREEFNRLLNSNKSSENGTTE